MIFGSTARLYFMPSVVCVLDAAVQGPEGEGSLSHYSRSYYVKARDERAAIALVREAEREAGATALEFEAPRPADEREVPDDVRRAVRGGYGVKWRSGRVFFPTS